MTTLWRDILYGCRMLANRPGFTIAAVLSLALGIGANTTIFSIINGTLLGQLPIEDQDRVAILWSVPVNRADARGSVGAQNYLAWKEQSKSFQAMGSFYGRTSNLGAEQNGSPAERIQGQLFTASLWDVLGVKPQLGRLFTADEDQVGQAAPVIVLSYEFWQRRFGGKPDVLGKSINVDSTSLTIIGVMPKGFRFADDGAEFWTPAGFSAQQMNSAATFLLVAGRLKEGVSMQQAQGEMASIGEGLRTAFPDRNRDRTVRVEPVQEAFFEGLKEPLFVLQGAVAFVLLIACANVAGLLLARAAARRTEVAVRAAVGAGRGRMIRQLLTESVLLSLGGAILGIGFAWAGLRMILAALPPGDLSPDVFTIDVRVLAFTAALSIATGLLFGLLPALQTSKVDLATALKESGRASMDGAGRQRVRSVLVAAQIGLALVLLIGAGLMMSSFLKLRSNNLGADPANLLTFEFRFPQTELMKPVGRYRGVGLWDISPSTGLTYQRVFERMQAIPGVQSAAAISRAPLSGNWMGMGFNIMGKPAPDPNTPGGSRLNAAYFAITPNYFGTMKIPLLRGRDLAVTDTASAPLVMVINKTMADRWFPNENPLGQRITLDFVPNEQPREIVGVVGDTLAGRYQRRPEPTMFLPHLQQAAQWQGPSWDYRAAMTFVMRTPGDPESIIPAVRSAIAEIDPSKPAGNIRTVEHYLNEQLAETRIFMMLLMVFGSAAAILAAIGIYGVMAYAVAQRTREIGIRMALGASGSNVMRLVVRQAIILIVVGMILGIGGAYALTRFLKNFLWNVSPTDPVTFASVAAGLVVVALVACLVPTRRAVRVDPTIALRYE